MKTKLIIYAIASVCVFALKGQELPAFNLAQNIEDFEFALEELESSYSGFDTYVNDLTRTEYNNIVGQLRKDIDGGRVGWDAALQLYSWFDDGHLGLSLPYRIAEKYMSGKHGYNPYSEIQPYEPTRVAKEVTPKTYLVRLPDFADEELTIEWIDSVINLVQSKQYQNLIIDLRNNGGGDERYWHPFLPLIYDHPGTVKSVEYRNSPQNIAYLQAASTEFPEAQMILDKIAENPSARFVLLTDTEDYDVDVVPTNGHKPNKIVIIIDNNVASAAEEFLLQARAVSNHVTIYGKENTNGMLDCGSVRENILPNSQIPIEIPTARSCRLPNNGIDKTGIAPDVRIEWDYPTTLTDNIDEWTLKIAEDLEK